MSSPAFAQATGAVPARFLYRHRNLMGSAVAGFLILFPWWRTPPPPSQVVWGSLLVLAGTALRLWSILQIGGRARKVVCMKALRVIQWGPYSICRNPLYAANILVFAGFSALSGHLWALPLVGVCLWLWYDRVVRQEERFLAEAFPEDFALYKRSTNRWVPRLRFRNRPAEVPPYPFLRALRRERAHLLAVLAGGVLVILFLTFPRLEPVKTLWRVLVLPRLG